MVIILYLWLPLHFFFIVPRQSPEAMTFNTGSAARGRGQGALLAVSLYSYFLLRVRAHRYEPLANQNYFASPNHRLLLNARGLRAYCWRYYKFRLSANIVFFFAAYKEVKSKRFALGIVRQINVSLSKCSEIFRCGSFREAARAVNLGRLVRACGILFYSKVIS